MTELLFPHVDVKIVDNSFTTSASAPAAMRMFSPVITEKGKDNVTQYITGTEYFKKYGKLDHRLHGQAGYNITNALSAGGGAYVLRVLPDDATFAHTILNIQTKVSKKKVLDKDGNLVDVDNVELRPVNMYLRNANTRENLITGLNYTYGKTVDGYTNNPFIALIPEGRGKYYNRYGFRITPTDTYDETYKFRTYLFETLETDDEGVTSTIEGPFLVSLEPGTKNLANESVFIKDVLDKYSEVYDALFNEQNYNNIVNAINPEVPSSVDIIFGSTRLIKEEKETYLNLTTGKEEDIHLSLHQYNEDGTPFEYVDGVPVLNMVDFDSKIQSTILDVDDTIRQLDYSESLRGVETMKLALSRFRKGAFKLLVDSLVTFDDHQNVTGGKLHTANENAKEKYEHLIECEDAYNDAPEDEEAYLKLIAAIDVYMDSVKAIKSLCLDVIFTAKTVASTTNLLDAVVQLVLFEQELGLYDIMKVNVASKIDLIIRLRDQLETARLIPVSSTKLNTIYGILVEIKEILRFVVAMDKEDQVQADLSVGKLKTAYNEAVAAYTEASDEFILPSELEELVLEAFDKTDKLISTSLKTTDLIMVENSLFHCKQVSELVDRFILESLQAVKDSALIAEDAYTELETREDLIKTMKINIGSAQADLVTLNFKRYNQDLRAYNTMLPLLNGSDGILETGTEAQRTLEAKNLFIKAFKGLIDDSVLDEDIMEFEALIDGNFDIDIKNAMTQLVTQSREDIVAVMDLGLTPSPAHAIEYRKNQLPIDNYRVFLYGQHFNIYDENTSSDITVTTPYFISAMIPKNESEYGLNQPLAGNRGVLSGFKQLSWNPNREWKNNLYKSQINYVEVSKNRTGVATQLTSQRRNSALSNINNVLMVLQLRRKVRQVLPNHLVEVVDDNYLESLNRDLAELANTEMNTGAYKSVNITAYADEYDLAQKKYRVRIEVVFKDIVERIAATISVQR